MSVVGCDAETEGLTLSNFVLDQPLEVGRNSFEKLKSVKSISRHQINLTFALNFGGKPVLKLLAVGTNPIIYSKKRGASYDDEPLDSKSEVELEDRDRFYLVTDNYQFEVRISEEKREKKGKEREEKEKEKEREREREGHSEGKREYLVARIDADKERKI